MNERNTVAVKIYGQEYNISGEMPREYIMKVSDYVDSKMREIGEGYTGSATAVAVLAAVNISDEYFKREADIEALTEKNAQMVSETQRYSMLWDEAKENLARYKEEMAGNRQQQEENIRTIAEKNDRLQAMSEHVNELMGHNDVLRARVEELTNQLNSVQAAPMEAEKTINDLEAKCRDIESSFFDIQMENIHLKNEVEELRRRLG
ncbi:MAG: cell division protein ZapA [Clostridia bacterium]|nr:cell division protein ZapA [Clostridia bacterium]